MLEFEKSQRFSGRNNLFVIPIEVVVDHVNGAPDVNVCNGSHYDAKLNVALVAHT